MAENGRENTSQHNNSGNSGNRPVILVTGADGLLGSTVAQQLSAQYTVVGTARHGTVPAGVHEVRMDVTSDESVRNALGQVREEFGEHIASVLHFAAYYSFDVEESPLYDAITVRGTERLLRELQPFTVDQFVFSSTMLVHKPCEPGQRITEDWPLLPKWAYPKSKVVTEEVIRAQRGPIPAVLLRIAGVYDDMGHSIPLTNQMQRIWERQIESHLYPGDISHGQSFVHRLDVANAYQQLVAHRGSLPEEVAILLGEPVTLSYDELQRAFGWLLHGEEWNTREIPKEMAKVGAWVENGIPLTAGFIKPFMIDLADDQYTLDITRARTLLEWEPQHSLRDTIPHMCDALKANPDHFYKVNNLTKSAIPL